ncbi:MAG: translation initiation factor IF-2 N-terminal domain-containing protein, partial [Actinomycetota bacterium]
MATAKIKVSELAKKLGMTNAELLDLCKTEGVAAKTPQSTLADAFVPLLERKAKAQGLVRDVQPEEAKPAKATKKAAKSETDGQDADATPKTTKKAAAPPTAEPEVTPPAAPEPAPTEPAPAVKSSRVISGRDATQDLPRPAAPVVRPEPRPDVP